MPHISRVIGILIARAQGPSGVYLFVPEDEKLIIVVNSSEEFDPQRSWAGEPQSRHNWHRQEPPGANAAEPPGTALSDLRLQQRAGLAPHRISGCVKAVFSIAVTVHGYAG